MKQTYMELAEKISSAVIDHFVDPDRRSEGWKKEVAPTVATIIEDTLGKQLLGVSAVGENNEMVRVEFTPGHDLPVAGALVAAMLKSPAIANIVLNATANYISMSKNPKEMLGDLTRSITCATANTSVNLS